MSEDSPSFQPFFVDRAKGGRAACKGCKDKCANAELRLAKIVASPYGEGQQMKSWFHVDCFMNALIKQRPTTKRIDSVHDIGNWSNISKEDQEFLLKKINEMEKTYQEKNAGKYTAKVIKNESGSPPQTKPSKEIPADSKQNDTPVKDDEFIEFHNLCKKISRVDAYTDKTAVVNSYFTKGTDGKTFKGDLTLWCKLLLPQVTKRVYNLKSKQLIKLFSKIYNTDQDDMLTHLEQGDVAKTIQHFFKISKRYEPASNSTLTIHDVEEFLDGLSKLTKEEEQIYQFKKIIKKCTLDDILMIIRLIKGDLRINAGPKHILDGVHPDAYTVFQTSRNLDMVIQRVLPQSSGVKHKDAIQSTVKAQLQLMTPILPMLAEACKSVEMAMKKCPNGMFSEIKYDGERVQVHKQGNEFRYYSRALKPIMPYKVSHIKDYLAKAFPKGEDLILDAEVLMVDIKTGKPLPFGSLGIHKRSEFKDAQVCLFVFDCLYYNGENLMDLPIRRRREILYEHMVEVKNHIMFSEQKLIKKPADLATMIAEVLQLGLEGLVLKDLESIYEPGKRHWLKVKKDYLFDGAMADTADLVVLGAWFGTGKKGGMMSVFLMGCHDPTRDKWVTVTKVHTGHDDATLERLQKELTPLMQKISQESGKVPRWLDCSKGLTPDYVARDPTEQPVWEITGTEFTKANIHTADGISVRFPRVTRIRTDKNWQTATNLQELKHLYKTSKEKTDVTLLNKLAETASKSELTEPVKKKIKTEKNADLNGKSRDSSESIIKKNTSPECSKSYNSKKSNSLNSSTKSESKSLNGSIKSDSSSDNTVIMDEEEILEPLAKKIKDSPKKDSPVKIKTIDSYFTKQGSSKKESKKVKEEIKPDITKVNSDINDSKTKEITSSFLDTKPSSSKKANKKIKEEIDPDKSIDNYDSDNLQSKEYSRSFTNSSKSSSSKKRKRKFSEEIEPDKTIDNSDSDNLLSKDSSTSFTDSKSTSSKKKKRKVSKEIDPNDTVIYSDSDSSQAKESSSLLQENSKPSSMKKKRKVSEEIDPDITNGNSDINDLKSKESSSSKRRTMSEESEPDKTIQNSRASSPENTKQCRSGKEKRKVNTDDLDETIRNSDMEDSPPKRSSSSLQDESKPSNTKSKKRNDRNKKDPEKAFINSDSDDSQKHSQASGSKTNNKKVRNKNDPDKSFINSDLDDSQDSSKPGSLKKSKRKVSNRNDPEKTFINSDSDDSQEYIKPSGSGINNTQMSEDSAPDEPNHNSDDQHSREGTPSSSDSPIEEDMNVPSLPDIFLGKKLGFYPDFISFPEFQRRQFERHWIAYGGTVTKSLKAADVDYVLHIDRYISFPKMQILKDKLPNHVRHVWKEWLIHCINEVALCDTKPYAVVVKASF